MDLNTFLLLKNDQDKPPEIEVDIHEDEFIYADDRCPKCGEYPPESPYKTRQIKLPKNVYMPIIKHLTYVNNLSGQGWDWLEFHVCKKCKTKYQFSNTSC